MLRARGNDVAAARHLLLALRGPDAELTEDEVVGGVLLARGLRNLERLTRLAGALAGAKVKED
ncbi:hypothetical protein [Myxococcus phage Mx4 ts27htf-1hrm-1]|nr:hypothetical protein Mx4_p58 [Myxococcus phage Mx4]WNM70397.1 hypothetical protein [Myxococcus phage Mx4 ts27htf-1hrm-1]